jgi:Tol biopolymer transport system component
MRTRALLTVALGLATAAPAVAGQAHASRIAWTQVLDDEFTTARIVSARPDGSGLRALTHPAAGAFDINAAISPDGSRVAFERDLPDGSAKLAIVGADGRSAHFLHLGCVDPCAADVDPSWTRVAGASSSPL